MLSCMLQICSLISLLLYLDPGLYMEMLLCLLACAFLLLFKGGLKDTSKTDSYRAIAGPSLLMKLFDNVVLLLWGDKLSSDPLQFGFERDTSTTQCSWLVMEMAGYFLRRGSPCILFSKLMSINLPPLVVRTLVFIYQEQFAWVKWGRVQFQQDQDPEWNKTWVCVITLVFFWQFI